MRFTVLAHASIEVEHAGARALVDPWFSGECYDHAWALLCERPDLVRRLERPDFVLYSHSHPDHFHVPTLTALGARFGADLPVVMPRQLTRRMADAARALGFRRVHEAAPAEPFRLGECFEVAFHPVRADDAVLVFRAGARTLLNANDCEIDGRVQRQLARRYAAVDFYLGQYSIGDAYPFRLDGVDAEDLRRAAAAPPARFRRQARAFGARHAVPTSSGFRFAHEDNRDLNRWGTTAEELATPDFPQLEILHPGDGWSEDAGFLRSEANRDAQSRAVAAVGDGSARCTARAPAPPAAVIESAAADRCTDMFRRVPRLLRQRLGRLGFHLDDLDRSLTVDWGRASLAWRDGAPADVPYYGLAADHFLNVCRSPHGWSALHIGGRFRLHRPPGDSAVERFLPVSLLYAHGYFDAGLLRPRLLEALWARRGQALDLLPRLWRLRQPAGDDFRRL